MRDSPLVQEFILEGEQIRARKDVLQALNIRFGEDTASEFTEQLARIEQLDQLDALHRLAIKARRISQFRTAITGLTST